MRIVIIGTGNVATVLGRKFLAAEHDVIQVCGRNELFASVLADTLATSYTTDLTQIDKTGDLYLLAVSDTAVATVAASLQLNKKMTVHTAGSVPKKVLESCTTNYGVLYPVQSLRRELNVLPDIPFLVDGNTPDDLAFITEVANSLSNQVEYADDDHRLKLHIAAVMVSNFTNHLYALAQAYCMQEKVDFHMLLPLITTIADRLYEYLPADMQTGPAMRQDGATIQKHLELLRPYPSLKTIYALFTESIQKMHKK